MKSVAPFVALLAFATSAIAAPVVAEPAIANAVVAVAAATATAAVDGTYQKTVLKHHNVHRTNHSAPDVAWGSDMAKWAEELASRCYFGHNTSIGTKPYGQNIAAGTVPYDISAVITDEFYNGEVNWFAGLYGENNPNLTEFEHWGHFSQVVWVGTTHVGCYTYNCTATGILNLEGDGIAPYLTVCNYYPYGNLIGAFADNVLPPLDNPTVYENY